MRTFRTSAGPFVERPYYSIDEVERICVEALCLTALLPKDPEPIRIDRFIEKRFKVVPEYKELGPGVLGMATFGRNGVQAITVAQALDDEASITSERRIRTTLAHEGGHGLLHVHLFAFANEKLLFGEYTPSGPAVLCRDITGTPKNSKYSGQWWEYQANMAMGSLLMPRSLVIKATDKFLVHCGQLGLKELPRGKRPEAITELSEIFDLNPIVVTIRLNEIFPENSSAQMSL